MVTPTQGTISETVIHNQGANLTSYELNEEEIPNTIIADNTGGILMQRGEVDMCIVGTDRTLSNGDVCNKIGTYKQSSFVYIKLYVLNILKTASFVQKSLKKSP